MAKNDDVSGEQVERLTDKEKRYDSEDAVLIIDGVEYDVLALWGHVEALEQALEASQQENERLREILEIIRPVLTDVSWADSEPMYPRSQFSLNKAADRWKVTIEDYPELVEWTRGNDAAIEEQEAQGEQ